MSQESNGTQSEGERPRWSSFRRSQSNIANHVPQAVKTCEDIKCAHSFPASNYECCNRTELRRDSIMVIYQEALEKCSVTIHIQKPCKVVEYYYFIPSCRAGGLRQKECGCLSWRVTAMKDGSFLLQQRLALLKRQAVFLGPSACGGNGLQNLWVVSIFLRYCHEAMLLGMLKRTPRPWTTG